MSVVSDLYKDVQLPRMIKVRQIFDQEEILKDQIPHIINNLLCTPKYCTRIKPGTKIAITAGSRGIANVALITKCVVDFVKTCGAYPFVIPAMGSHGGATAEGQRQILQAYGITENYLGCPIQSSMDVVKIGETSEGHPVYQDKYANEADGIILSCRVKPHNAFHGVFESGFLKMASVGLGNRMGAEVCHREDQQGLARLVPLIGKKVLRSSNILFGLCVIENFREHTSRIAAVTSDEILEKEPLLLNEARALMPRIWIDKADLLVIDEIGKNISGGGADSNIVGRYYSPNMSGGIQAQRIAVLDLTEETHGNFAGTGIADVITSKLFRKADFEETYPNIIVSRCLVAANIPLVIHGDANAMKVAIQSCFNIDFNQPRIVRIKNTRDLDTIYVSEVLLNEVRQNPHLEVLSEPEYMTFDDHGNAVNISFGEW